MRRGRAALLPGATQFSKEPTRIAPDSTGLVVGPPVSSEPLCSRETLVDSADDNQSVIEFLARCAVSGSGLGTFVCSRIYQGSASGP